MFFFLIKLQRVLLHLFDLLLNDNYDYHFEANQYKGVQVSKKFLL